MTCPYCGVSIWTSNAWLTPVRYAPPPEAGLSGYANANPAVRRSRAEMITTCDSADCKALAERQATATRR